MNKGTNTATNGMQSTEITLECDLSEVLNVELTAQRICESVGFDDEHGFMIVLAISEALTNIMVHGLAAVKNPGLSGNANAEDTPCIGIRVAFHYCPSHLIVSLYDGGKAYPEAIVRRLHHGVAGDFHVPDDPLDIQDRGRGIDLILLAASSVSYQRANGRNHLELTFDSRSTDQPVNPSTLSA